MANCLPAETNGQRSTRSPLNAASGRSVTRSLTEPELTPSRQARKQVQLSSRYVCTAP